MLDYRIALGNAIKAARTELNLTQGWKMNVYEERRI